jgi:hypothetical protein
MAIERQFLELPEQRFSGTGEFIEAQLEGLSPDRRFGMGGSDSASARHKAE